MSKPNLLGFSSSLGIYRNKRIRDLRAILMKEVNRKVAFAELSPMLFQVLMAYAGENQINGDFSRYTTQDILEIFATNNVPVSLKEAEAIRKSFGSVGLLDGGKIRSWSKFNRHFGEHEKIVKAKRKAAKIMHDKWTREARSAARGEHSEASQNGEGTVEKTAPKPVQKAAQKDSPSKALWMLDQALNEAPRGSAARKELLARRKKLLSDHQGLDLSTPSPAPAAPSPKPRKRTRAEEEAEFLLMAESTLRDVPEALSEGMALALVRAGHKLPAAIASKFPKLHNPVPE